MYGLSSLFILTLPSVLIPCSPGSKKKKSKPLPEAGQDLEPSVPTLLKDFNIKDEP